MAITSNGVLLKSMAQRLAEAGLDSANISIDTLSDDKFENLTGSYHLNKVISGIETAMKYIDKVKLNTVLIRGFNDEDIRPLILFADDRGLDIRFIEFMPNRYSAPDDPRFISGREMRQRLPWDFKSLPGKPGNAAQYYTSPDLKIKVGFIDSVSHPFCNGCDRIRLAADGRLYRCLYGSKSINLFDLLEKDPDRALTEYERLTASEKYKRSQSADDSRISLPSFSAIGG
jgi:cyclic pyranopterin phosphate synthase